MYDKDDLKISGNSILVKEYDALSENRNFTWVTLIDLTQANPHYLLKKIMNAISN